MRYLDSFIKKDLLKKMVFLGGPRQCGKTTLALSLLKPSSIYSSYLNWDTDEDRQAILQQKWLGKEKLIVLDELHKFPRWKNWIKGQYDKYKNQHQFLVTGSARLDLYRRGGDSLLGRYHYWRLHPFSLHEIPKGINPKEAFQRLMTVGGFPEPFFDNNETEARRWRKERTDRVIKDDIRDLEAIKDIQTLSLMLSMLKSRVGGMIMYANLAQDLHISAPTVKRWIESLEKMYMIFSVHPYTKNLPRAIQKPPKVYFFDNADVAGDEGAIFENLVANHLLKRIHFLEDSTGHTYKLNYLRDKEGREVDFVITKDNQVEELIEVKWSDDNPSKSLIHYAEKLKPKKAYQIVAHLKRPFHRGSLYVENPIDFFAKL
jgi:predicted AAA+ superfamily ATPase